MKCRQIPKACECGFYWKYAAAFRGSLMNEGRWKGRLLTHLSACGGEALMGDSLERGKSATIERFRREGAHNAMRHHVVVRATETKERRFSCAGSQSRISLLDLIHDSANRME